MVINRAMLFFYSPYSGTDFIVNNIGPFLPRLPVIFYIKRKKEKHLHGCKKYFRRHKGDQAKDEINLAGKGEKGAFQKH